MHSLAESGGLSGERKPLGIAQKPPPNNGLRADLAPSRLGYGREVHFERAKHPPRLLVPIAYFRFIFRSRDFHVLKPDFHHWRTSVACGLT